MDSRAKQRLTGAVILVALVVLLVPEMLTGPREKHPPAESPNDGIREYTIDIDEQNRQAQPSSAPVANPATSDTQVAPSAAAANKAPALAVPGEAAVPEPTAVPPPAPTSAPASAPAPRVEPPRSSGTNPRVERGSFVVQLGSFGSRDNADRLVRDMTARGFTAFVAPITSNGRELFRVRVGPTRDRASAEALAAELKRIGQTGSIVPIS
jgi:DedD protein